MRNLILLFLVLQCGALSAQNWALINPDYKYNYSNDGTDTISNQIFVTHIDTLGVDSFRYELNLIGLRCDTCVASLGSYCDGSFIRTDQPQFLGFSVLTNQWDWHLTSGTDEQRIISNAQVGNAWLFDPVGPIGATVVSISGGMILGQVDSLKLIALSNGDSIILSKDHGLVRYPNLIGPVDHYDLIGTQNPQLGHVIPGIADFFGLQPGDVVEYARSRGSAYWPVLFASNTITKRTIQSRTVINDTIHFNVISTSSHNEGWHDETTQQGFHQSYSGTGPEDWSIPNSDLPSLDLLTSYPGQVYRSTYLFGPDVDQSPIDASIVCIAEHGLGANGEYFIRARYMPGIGACSGFSLLSPTDSVAPDLYGDHGFFMSMDTTNLLYETSVGFIAFNGEQFERGGSYLLVGAVIDGDSIGTLTPDDVLLGVPSVHDQPELSLGPVPADDILHVLGTSSLRMVQVWDMQGQLLLDRSPSSSQIDLDVSDLAVGVYVLHVIDRQGQRTQRFTIAR